MSISKQIVALLVFPSYDHRVQQKVDIEPIYAWHRINKTLANSLDPDQTLQNARSRSTLFALNTERKRYSSWKHAYIMLTPLNPTVI